MTYYVQQKHGMNSGWYTTNKTSNLKQAIGQCEKLVNKNRRPWEKKWYKSRVVIKVNGKNGYQELERIFPPKKKAGE